MKLLYWIAGGLMAIAIVLLIFNEVNNGTSSELFASKTVEVSKGYYDDITAQGFNGYKPNTYTVEELQDGQVQVMITFTKMR